MTSKAASLNSFAAPLRRAYLPLLLCGIGVVEHQINFAPVFFKIAISFSRFSL